MLQYSLAIFRAPCLEICIHHGRRIQATQHHHLLTQCYTNADTAAKHRSQFRVATLCTSTRCECLILPFGRSASACGWYGGNIEDTIIRGHLRNSCSNPKSRNLPNGSGWEIGIQQVWYALADSCGNVYLTISGVWIVKKKRLNID